MPADAPAPLLRRHEEVARRSGSRCGKVLQILNLQVSPAEGANLERSRSLPWPPSISLLRKDLPANVDAERFVLGSILLNQDTYFQVAGAVEPEDFSLEKHRRIFARMKDLYDRGEKIDRVTLANELMKQGQLESVDGFSYLVSLDDGLPALSNLDSYIRIVKDKATLRKLIFSAQKVIDRCLIGEEEPDEILAGAEESLLKLGEARAGERLESPADGDQ